MGGMIGMWLGVNAPEALNKLMLCNTGPPKIGNPEVWNAPQSKQFEKRHESVASAVIERWFCGLCPRKG